MIGIQISMMLLISPFLVQYRGDFCVPFGQEDFCESLGIFFLIIPIEIITCKIIQLMIFYITNLEAFALDGDVSYARVP